MLVEPLSEYSLHEGQPVILLAFEENPQERARVVGTEVQNGTVMVEVIPEDRYSRYDDGLREVPLDQIKDARMHSPNPFGPHEGPHPGLPRSS